MLTDEKLRYTFGDDYVLNNMQNGHGVQMYVPEQMRDYGQEITYQDATVFPEAAFVAHSVLKRPKQAMLVWGEPGSGKSHLTDDLLYAVGAANNAPAMSLSLHIAGGASAGLENARGYVNEFLARIGDKKGLLILDNLDYLGYKGSRRRNRAQSFAEGITDLTQAVIDNPRLITLGMVHDVDWRIGTWQWNDPAVDIPAQRALNLFSGDAYHFQGHLSVPGLVQTVVETWRNLDEAAAERHVGKLALNGHGDFFHARHVNPELYAENPDAALAQATEGRLARKRQV